MSNIYFMCENCGIETNGITLVNGMKFCAKCYHQIFGKDNQQTEIAQLKQQLADKQNTIDEINKEFVQAVHDWKALCAEKDKEIEDCKRNELYEENMKILAVKNQTQLALQELEKVKELLLIESKNNPIVYDVNDDTVGGALDRDKTFEIIDQQIKELKGE